MYLFRLNRWWVVDATKAVSVCAHARPGRLFSREGAPVGDWSCLAREKHGLSEPSLHGELGPNLRGVLWGLWM